MKITTEIGIENKDIAGDFNSKKAGINQDSLPFLFEMMSKNLYSNPIGSIVREITSNCFDSHKEANVDDAVIIRRGEDDEGEYISFCDFGVGLSPRRIEKVYMNYFSSTKRGDNEQIGGFGLGSKTPFAYTDMFYITTNFNGKKYKYIFSKADVPILDCLNAQGYDEVPNGFAKKMIEYEDVQIPVLGCEILKYPIGEDTTERNGTEIKIHIKNRNDVDKFQNELQKQLCYFDNVVFEDWDIDNDYKIYEGKTFKFRNTYQYSDETHVLLGKVAYPINWEEIGIEGDLKYGFKIPVGVIFEIGELQVTPNRETIRYTDASRILIKEKVLACIEEITTLYKKEAKVLDDFYIYWRHRNERPHIKLGEDDKLYLTGLGEAKITFKPFDELGINIGKGEAVDNNLRKMFQSIYNDFKGAIVDNKLTNSRGSNIFDLILNKTPFCVTSKEHKGIVYYANRGKRVYSKKTDLKFLYSLFVEEVEDTFEFTPMYKVTQEWDSNYHYRTYTTLPLTISQNYNVESELNINDTDDVTTINVDPINIITTIPTTLTNFTIYNDNFQWNISRNYQRSVSVKFSPLGTAMKAYKLYKLLKEITKDLEVDLDTCEVDFRDEEDYNHFKLRTDSSLRRRREGKIACEDIINITTRDERKLEDLDNFKGLIVYGFREDTQKLLTAKQLLKWNCNFLNNKDATSWYNNKAIQILKISKSNQHYFLNNKNMTHVDGLYSDNKVFRRVASVFRAMRILKNIGVDGIETMKLINEEVYDLIKEIEVYYDNHKQENWYNFKDPSSAFKAVLEVADKYNLYDPSISYKFELIEKYFEGAEMLKITKINEANLPIILKYLREKKKKINLEYYQKFVKDPKLGEQVEFNFEEEENKTKFVVLTNNAA